MSRNSLAKIAKGTKRKKRDINLLQVAQEIKAFYTIHQSFDKVAKIVKLSPEMVRQFYKITELEESVKELIKAGLIGSVDVGYRISRLSEKHQAQVAKHLIDQKLSSDDIRAIVRYKLDNPKIPIKKAINTVVESKDKKIYVAYLSIGKDIFEELTNKNKKRIIKSIFYNRLSRDFISYFNIKGRVVLIKVTREGLREIRAIAKKLKVPLAKLGDALVKDYLKRKER